MSLLVTGSIGIDSVRTPHGSADDVLGGSAVYFTFAARLFTPVRFVGVVGEDFPDAFRSVMDKPDIDLRGLETRAGSKTFRWTGKYLANMNERETLDLALNVLGEAGPQVPDAFTDSDVVFLANTNPSFQQSLLARLTKPKLAVCDTMDIWIDNERDELLKTLSLVDGVIINDGEALQLTGKTNAIDAAENLLTMGPRFAVVKKGEHGAILMTEAGPTAIPAFVTHEVRDPTGAGDSFAGGMVGYLAATGDFGPENLRRAIVRGTVAASFTIEGFSLSRLLEASSKDVDRRVRSFVEMLRFDG